MRNNAIASPFFYPPLIPGEIKRHYLGLYQMAIFYGMKFGNNTIEINYNLKSLKGFPDMYYDNCKTFGSLQS